MNTLLEILKYIVKLLGNYCVLPEYHKCMLPPLT